MVQKEVKKKTARYAIVALLSALVLVTLIYSFGAAPTIFPPGQTPFVAGMKTFSSIEELKTYLSNTTTNGNYGYRGGPLDSRFFGNAAPTSVPQAATAESILGFGETKSAAEDSSYSTTNIQVAGVDEADTVKTDGQYIYTISTTQSSRYYYGYGYGSSSESSNAVYVLNADPQNPEVVAKISLGNDTEPAGLFLTQDGSKLVVLASKYETYSYGNGVTSYPPITHRRCCNANACTLSC